MPTRAEVIAEARKHLGTRWIHQGRWEGIGLDCLGLVVVVARNLGYKVQDTSTYDIRPDPVLLRSEVERQLIPTSSPRLGSILLLHFNTRTRTAYHFAFLSGEDAIIHAYAKARKVVEDTYSELWAPRLTAAFDFPGLAD